MKNRTIFTGDNLDVMRGIDSQSVDLIYLDPPFNSNRNYSAPIGSRAAGAAFKDTWTLDDVDEAWHGEIADRDPALYATIGAARLTHSKGMQSYLTMMAVRMLEMRRILKPTGSIYLHVDPTASHYLKCLMDSIFGRENFGNEIVWCYKGSNSPTKARFNAKHDSILFYRSNESTFHNQYLDYGAATLKQYNRVDSEGRRYRMHSYRADGSERRLYLDQAKGIPVSSWWTDINSFGTATQSKERTGYPTQKPLALLERIIKASSNPGDIVLDPFCGCATTCVAAEKLGRRWLGIDLSSLAVGLVRTRLSKECGDLICDVTERTDLPQRTDLGELPNYRTHKHTLYGRQEGVCTGCLMHFPFRNLTIDHRIPRVHGGSDHISNLQLLCQACNSQKGTGSQARLVAKLIKSGIRQT